MGDTISWSSCLKTISFCLVTEGKKYILKTWYSHKSLLCCIFKQCSLTYWPSKKFLLFYIMSGRERERERWRKRERKMERERDYRIYMSLNMWTQFQTPCCNCFDSWPCAIRSDKIKRNVHLWKNQCPAWYVESKRCIKNNHSTAMFSEHVSELTLAHLLRFCIYWLPIHRRILT